MVKHSILGTWPFTVHSEMGHNHYKSTESTLLQDGVQSAHNRGLTKMVYSQHTTEGSPRWCTVSTQQRAHQDGVQSAHNRGLTKMVYSQHTTEGSPKAITPTAEKTSRLMNQSVTRPIDSELTQQDGRLQLIIESSTSQSKHRLQND